MILLWLISILLAGGVLALIAGLVNGALSRWISAAALFADLALAAAIWGGSWPGPESGAWIAELSLEWLPRFGISLHLGMDGLSLFMTLLTIIMGLAAVLASWSEIKEKTGFFHFNVMWTLAGILGVFLSLDLFLFYFFWEVMLVPMYFLIGIWGHEKRVYAAVKFFLFTQAGGLLMFIAIIALYFIHGRATGAYTFDYPALLGTAIAPGAARWLMLGFTAAFVVKLPALPFHSWLPDAHSEAPTAGSVILAGLLLKTGAYGLIRFVVPLFPSASVEAAPFAMAVGAAGVLYGAMLAFSQTDLKRLIAYTSVSHMGFVLMGIFAMNDLALRGVMVQLAAHAVSTGALFIIAGALKERLHTRDLARMGGFWTSAPRMGAAAMVFALASLGLPGMGNFIAEFLILAGTFAVSPWIASAAAIGLVLSAAYSLRIIQRVFHGDETAGPVGDFNARETGVMAVLAVMIFALGLYPRPVMDAAHRAIRAVSSAPGSSAAGSPSVKAVDAEQRPDAAAGRITK